MRAQVSKIINKKGEVTIDTTDIQSAIRNYYEKSYGSKMDNLEEMDELLESYNLPRLNQE